MSFTENIKPLADRVVVRRFEEQTRSVGGIYIPENAKEKPIEATVVAVGRGRWCDGQIVALEVVVGDTVVIGKYAGTEIKLNGEPFTILREDDILAVKGKVS